MQIPICVNMFKQIVHSTDGINLLPRKTHGRRPALGVSDGNAPASPDSNPRYAAGVLKNFAVDTLRSQARRGAKRIDQQGCSWLTTPRRENR